MLVESNIMFWAPNFSSVKRSKFYVEHLEYISSPLGLFLFPYVTLFGGCPEESVETGMGWFTMIILPAMGAVNSRGLCVTVVTPRRS